LADLRESREPEIVTHKGKPVSVIIPIKDYEELLERVEDADDVTSLKRAHKKTAALPYAGGLSRRAQT
jgi:prevent-host-death family protein